MNIFDKIKLKYNQIRFKFLSKEDQKDRLKNICINYFNSHPQEKAVFQEKANLLALEDWRINNRYSHTFGSYLGKDRCIKCKCPIPDEIQNDAYLYECPKNEYICGVDGWEEFKLKVNSGAYNPYYNFTDKKVENIKNILKDEYDLYIQTIERGKQICLKKWDTISEITGKDLCWLHNTHGFHIEDVEGIYNESLTKEQKSEYESEYEKHKITGKLGEIKTVITVKYE